MEVLDDETAETSCALPACLDPFDGGSRFVADVCVPEQAPAGQRLVVEARNSFCDAGFFPVTIPSWCEVSRAEGNRLALVLEVRQCRDVVPSEECARPIACEIPALESGTYSIRFDGDEDGQEFDERTLVVVDGAGDASCSL